MLALANSMLEAHIGDKEDDIDYTPVIESKSKEVEKLQSKLSAFIDMRAEGEIDKETFAVKTAETKADIAKLTAEIQELEVKMNKEPVIEDYTEKLTVLRYALNKVQLKTNEYFTFAYIIILLYLH